MADEVKVPPEIEKAPVPPEVMFRVPLTVRVPLVIVNEVSVKVVPELTISVPPAIVTAPLVAEEATVIVFAQVIFTISADVDGTHKQFVVLPQLTVDHAAPAPQLPPTDEGK